MRIRCVMMVVVIMFAAHPIFVYADADNWAAPEPEGGKKVVGCTRTDATNSALQKCGEWATNESDATYKYVIQDVRLAGFTSQSRHGSFYDNWRECTWQATYQCGYKKVPLN